MNALAAPNFSGFFQRSYSKNLREAQTELWLVPGVHIMGYDADLAALAALSTTGHVVRTGTATFALRTITGTASEIDVANGSGVAGNPTISLPSAIELGVKTLTRGAYHKMRSVSIGQLEDDRAGGDTLCFISETIDNSFGGGAGAQWHNFAVTNTVTRTGGASGNGFTDNTTINGSGSYGHYAAYQFFLTHNTSGTTGSVIGFNPNLDVTAGTVTVYRAFQIVPPTLSGSGAITSMQGLYIGDISASATTPVAIQTDGTAPVKFGGRAEITGNAHVNHPHLNGDSASITTAGNGTITAANFITNLINRTGPTADYTDTLPTAANIYDVTNGPGRGSDIPGKRGDYWYYKNGVDYTATLSNNGGTVTSGGDTIRPKETAVYRPLWNGNGSGTESVVLLRIGSITNGVFRAQDGSATIPSIGFASDANTGFYWSSGDQVNLSLGGALAFTWYGFGLLGPDGAAGTPTFSFVNDADTGMYRSTGNVLGFSAGSTAVETMDATNGVNWLISANLTRNQDATSQVFVSNNSSGTSARADFWVSNNGATSGAIALIAGGTGYTGITQWQDMGVLNTGASLSGMIIRAATGSVVISTGAVTNAQVTVTSGIQVGAPTGGDKGAGTINVAADIYKNNTAYTNPDYVFEREYTGGIVRFADRARAKGYGGRLSLDALRSYTREHLRLPGISGEPAGMFERTDIALEKIEELTLYVLDIHDRLAALEH